MVSGWSDGCRAVRRFWCVGLLLAVTTAYPWGQTGHRVVAQIAENHLAPAVHMRLQGILDAASLSEVSTWLDEIKSDKSTYYKRFKAWHYITVADDVDVHHMAHGKQGDLVTGIQYAKDILAHQSQHDKRTIWEAVAILTHLVADAHQPLHVSEATDFGGNVCRVYWFSTYHKTNLHKVWDTLLLNSYGLSFTELSAFLDKADDNQVAAMQNSTVEDWLLESKALHTAIYPDSPDGGYHTYCQKGNQKWPILSSQYVYQNKRIVNTRLLQAGIRLAGLLNALV